MLEISKEKLADHRAHTFRTAPGQRVASAEEAVQFVDERGFIFFWPIKGVDLPSLWVAAVGDRPVPNDHDDPGHVTWDWKDSMLGKKRWYYARVLRRRNMMISLALAPCFYALSPNFGDPENDYLEEYQAGTLSLEAKWIYETLLREGPLDTLSLRREAHLSGESSAPRFNKALDDLQVSMKILPVGISQAGSWHYAFIYDIVPRHFPDLQERARGISENQARKALLEAYFLSVGVAEVSAVGRLFGWRPEALSPALDALIQGGSVRPAAPQQGSKGNTLALASLIA